MKLFISVDMEGIACVTGGDQVKMEGTAYEQARKWMTGETNAAIDGARAAGVTDIVVADGHGLMRNLLPDELHEDVQLISGTPRSLLQMEGIDESFDLAFMIGYHARAGDGIGVMAHTHVGKIVHGLRVNDEPVTEAAFNAMTAGHFGVPVGLVAGDDRIAAEVNRVLPWVETVITKWALGTLAARTLTPGAAQKRIRAAAEAVVGRLETLSVLRAEQPIRFEVSFLKQLYAQLASDVPGAERIDARTVRYVGTDMVEISRVWRLMINASLSSFAV